VIDKSAIDPNALQFYRTLKEAGFSAYFVGGSVRDLLLGKHPKDFDIATNATPHQIKKVIPQGRIIGRRFRHVMLEKGNGRYEIVTFRGPVVQAEEEIAELDDEPLENQPSMDTQLQEAPDKIRAKSYPDLNQFGNAEQDALRRDFTINALFYDPDSDELVDYVEGKLDIDRKLVRTIGEAAIRMEEDPIRILRAIRHKIKLGLDYDPALEKAMRDKGPLLETTSKDRIREEFLKVCLDQSLGEFLQEAQKFNLGPHILPWLKEAAAEDIKENFALLDKFKELPLPERTGPDMGLALMMIPLVRPLVIEEYKKAINPTEKNQLPDMKYFLSCEPLRNFYLRNLRISRAQTDYLVRALFYFSRMTGLWLEQGPPRRIIGKLFHHPSAILAAKMSRLFLIFQGKETPDWMTELADYDPAKRRRPQGPHQSDDNSDTDHGSEGESTDDPPQETEGREESHSRHRRVSPEEIQERPRRGEDRNRQKRLPPPDKPMIWNGPLHAPVLRPVFPEETAIRWSRKNQTVRAFRPSGIPNQPVDNTQKKASLVYNYKPELEEVESDESSRESRPQHRDNKRGRDREHRGGRERGNDRNDRRRGRNSGPSRPQHSRQEAREPEGREVEAQPDLPRGPIENRNFDEDSIGNIRLPGENPAALGHSTPANDDYYEDEDDNIGNRLDAPPTSGHVGVNGEGFVNPSRNSQPRGPGRFQSRDGGRRHGGGGGRQKRRGGGRGNSGGYRGPSGGGNQGGPNSP